MTLCHCKVTFSLCYKDNLVPEETVIVTNTVSCTNCTFNNNSSPTGGSAVNLVSSLAVDQVVVTANFSNW